MAMMVQEPGWEFGRDTGVSTPTLVMAGDTGVSTPTLVMETPGLAPLL